MTKNETIQFRFALKSDARAILEIYRPAVEKNAISFEERLPDETAMQERIEKTSQTYPWIVAIGADSNLIGYAYASSHRQRAAYRWAVEVSVYIDVQYQRLGLARQLYDQLFEILTKLNYHRALAGITLPNLASVKLHESMGFRHLGTYSNIGFKFGKWHDVGWWEKDLQPLSPPTPRKPVSFTQWMAASSTIPNRVETV